MKKHFCNILTKIYIKYATIVILIDDAKYIFNMNTVY